MENLAERIIAGETRAAARLMRWVENQEPRAADAMRSIHARTGEAALIGITGNPGSGKSTLTDRLVARFRDRQARVGVVAVDPSSPFTGGAIMGDRLRMDRHFTDPEVFIRSLATRGHLGGLSKATGDVVRIMEAWGADPVLIETVGVGQGEVDVARMAHTALVVMTPGMGDEIQAIKAGIMEIADIFVVNKADRPGADRTINDIGAMLEMLPQTEGKEWKPPIVRTVAFRDEGIDEVVQAIADHRAWLDRFDEISKRRARRNQLEFLALLQDRLLRRTRRLMDSSDFAGMEERLSKGEIDPYSLADRIFSQLNETPNRE